mgnify:CR=1 FL=1
MLCRGQDGCAAAAWVVVVIALAVSPAASHAEGVRVSDVTGNSLHSWCEDSEQQTGRWNFCSGYVNGVGD